MNADVKALAYERAVGYREGWIKGYGEGIEDGKSHGYTDAKARAHIAVQDADPEVRARVTAIVGKVE